MGAFKSYVGLWFYQGAFINDPAQLLVNAQEGKTKAMRQMRFNSSDEIDVELIKTYVLEAIQNQKVGKELKPDLKKPLLIPVELQVVLDNDVSLKTSFEQFTPGKQRDFADYISEAKRLETKQKRLKKIIPMIHQGLAMNDIYRK